MKRDSVGQAFLKWKAQATLAVELNDALFRAFQAGYVFGVEETAKTAMQRTMRRDEKRAREAAIKAARQLR